MQQIACYIITFDIIFITICHDDGDDDDEDEEDYDDYDYHLISRRRPVYQFIFSHHRVNVILQHVLNLFFG